MLSLSPSIFLSLSLPLSLSLRLSLFWSLSLPLCLSVCLLVSLSLHQSCCLSLFWSLCLSPSLPPSISLSLPLSLSLPPSFPSLSLSLSHTHTYPLGWGKRKTDSPTIQMVTFFIVGVFLPRSGWSLIRKSVCWKDTKCSFSCREEVIAPGCHIYLCLLGPSQERLGRNSAPHKAVENLSLSSASHCVLSNVRTIPGVSVTQT